MTPCDPALPDRLPPLRPREFDAMVRQRMRKWLSRTGPQRRLGVVFVVWRRAGHLVRRKSRVARPTVTPVSPRRYRAIALEILASCPGTAVYINHRLCTDYSESGPLTQRRMRDIIDFEMVLGTQVVMAYHDHPREMRFGARFDHLARRLERLGLLGVSAL